MLLRRCEAHADANNAGLSVSKLQNAIDRDGLSKLWGMIACLSGSGAFGGSIGVARAAKLGTPQFCMTVAIGVTLAVTLAWAIWRAGSAFVPLVLSRLAISPSLSWRKVTPIVYFVLSLCFLVLVLPEHC